MEKCSNLVHLHHRLRFSQKTTLMKKNASKCFCLSSPFAQQWHSNLLYLSSYSSLYVQHKFLIWSCQNAGNPPIRKILCELFTSWLLNHWELNISLFNEKQTHCQHSSLNRTLCACVFCFMWSEYLFIHIAVSAAIKWGSEKFNVAIHPQRPGFQDCS